MRWKCSMKCEMGVEIGDRVTEQQIPPAEPVRMTVESLSSWYNLILRKEIQ